LILSIDNITVSNHLEDDEYELADKKLKPATGFADYGITITTGFSRYEFLQENGASVALKMYQDIAKKIYLNGIICTLIRQQSMYVLMPRLYLYLRHSTVIKERIRYVIHTSALNYLVTSTKTS